MEAFREMHVSPAKHSYAWLTKKVWLPDRHTHTRTDRRRTKWSLCAAMLRRRHKNSSICLHGNGFKEQESQEFFYVIFVQFIVIVEIVIILIKLYAWICGCPSKSAKKWNILILCIPTQYDHVYSYNGNAILKYQLLIFFIKMSIFYKIKEKNQFLLDSWIKRKLKLGYFAM